MAVTEGPEALICSARGCPAKAAWAIVWSNPKIHYGRTKTWLSCDAHREHLTQYLGYRDFPVEVLALDKFLEQEAARDADRTT